MPQQRILPPQQLATYLLTTFLIWSSFWTAGCQSSQTAAVEAPPNILIIYADDLGYGDLGSYNPDSKIPTPQLDKLAAQGTRFTDGHSSSAICTPSRYALLTGNYHWRKFHGFVSVFGESVFDPHELTLPEMLQAKGYRTALIGKWHLGWDWASIVKEAHKAEFDPAQRRAVYSPDIFDWSKPIADGPLAHGFDYYFGDTVINFPPYAWIENDRVVEAPDTMMDTSAWKPLKEGTWECREGPMVTGWDPYENIPTTTEKGVQKIHEMAQDGKPFFLLFAFPSPHAPIIPNEEFEGSSEAGPYGDFVVETDAACGRLLQALEDAGVDDNTIVIFSADNGPEHYAYERFEKFGHWSAEPLRGLKRDIYEGGHRVPFIVKWPGVTPAATVNSSLISQIDLMATLAAVVGYDLPEDQAVDSQNLLPLFERVTQGSRRTLIHNTFQEKFAIRHDHWLLVNAENGYHSSGYEAWEEALNYPPSEDRPVELYDLRHDLAQRQNLADTHPAIVEKLQGKLKAIQRQGTMANRTATD